MNAEVVPPQSELVADGEQILFQAWRTRYQMPAATSPSSTKLAKIQRWMRRSWAQPPQMRTCLAGLSRCCGTERVPAPRWAPHWWHRPWLRQRALLRSRHTDKSMSPSAVKAMTRKPILDMQQGWAGAVVESGLA